jgi:hypothetical protein
VTDKEMVTDVLVHLVDYELQERLGVDLFAEVKVDDGKGYRDIYLADGRTMTVFVTIK